MALWPQIIGRREGSCYLGHAGARVLAVQQEGDPASLHLPFEEMLLGNPNHLCKLPKESEGLQPQRLILLIARGTSRLSSGNPAKPKTPAFPHGQFQFLDFHRAFWILPSGQFLLPWDSCSTQETGHDSSLGEGGIPKACIRVYVGSEHTPLPAQHKSPEVLPKCE